MDKKQVWNEFCSNDDEQKVKQEETKRVIKKNDGLFERIGGKTFITEDNKQLLND